MLHQIALYRTIPEMKQELRGFIEECQIHLYGCSNRTLLTKYRTRLHHAESTLKTLSELHRCLDE